MPVQPQQQRKGWALPPTEEDELDEDRLEAPVHLNTNFSSFVVVDHVPQVPVEKYEKLKAVLAKIVTGLAGNFVQLILPQDEKKNTKGYAFIEFSTAEAAQTAIDKVDGYKLDKDHIFKVSTFDDFQKYLNVPDEYVAPEIPPYQPRENLRSWVLDERAIDQYVIRYGDVTEILWNELKPSYGEDQESVLRREGFTDIYASWSPLGSYLATLHTEGVAIWGGPDFKKLGKFPHSNVRVVDFSPCEKYLITASSLYQENDDPKNPQCVIVWDVRTGARLRGFLGQMVKIKDTKDGKEGKELQWPAFKWSHDDKYFARLTEDTISVYETPSMDLLDKKSIKIPGVKDFCWSPSENIISYFVPEANNNNKPTSVVLIDIPSRSPRSQKNLFNVSDCKLYWHPSGDYLCVKVDRLTKTKKSVLTDFVFFRMREKGIPIEVVEIKETITTFAWEPKGTKFAVLHGEAARADVSFYSMGHKVKLLKTLEKKPVNQLLWSPQGGFIVLAGVGTLNGTFEFFNANELETMATEEHFNASLVEWDPSGRYVSTCVTFWRHQVENGYHIYSFQGKLLKTVLKEKFYQLNWRPRPPSLLPKERIEYIRKNIKEFAKQLKAEDTKKIEKEREKRRAKRAALRQDFERILRKNKQIHEEEATKRRELRFGEESDNEEDYEVREQWIEEIQDIQEIVINED